MSLLLYCRFRMKLTVTDLLTLSLTEVALAAHCLRIVSYTHSFSGSMTWHPVSICSSATSSVQNVKIDDGSKLAYVFTRSLLQAFDSLLLFFCCFLVTSCLHSRALSTPETSCLLSVFNLHTLANTVCLPDLRLTCMPSSSKEKLLYLVIPGISLFSTAAGILKV